MQSEVNSVEEDQDDILEQHSDERNWTIAPNDNNILESHVDKTRIAA